MKRPTRWKAGTWILAACAGISISWTGCGGDPAAPPPMVDSGSWYVTGFRWPHDGRPVESAHFTVYSDAASEQARRTLAQLAEDALADTYAQLGITDPQSFRFPPGQQKIHIYAYRDRYPRTFGGYAYWGGFLIYSLDHPERSQEGHTALSTYVPVVQHEIVHVIESLLRAGYDPATFDAWLTEAIAEFVSGGTGGARITDTAKFDQLIATYGQLNPIAMHRYTDFPSAPAAIVEYVYPMFHLAATYLFDAQGQGASLRDVSDLYLDARAGVAFATAFENRFGLSLADFEAQFFTLMRDYLGRLP